MAMVVTDCSMDRWALRNPDLSMPSPRADPPPATDGVGRDSFILVNDDDDDDDDENDEVPPPPPIAPADLPEFHLSAPSALTSDAARSALTIRYVGFTHTFPLVPPPEAAAASHGSQFVSSVEYALVSYGTTLRWDGGTAMTLLPTRDNDGLGVAADGA